MKNEIQQVGLEGDEEIIDQLYDHLAGNFPKLRFKKKVPLTGLFPEPESRWLKGFWNRGSHADIAVFRHGELVCILEPGGYYHLRDERQKTRDKKKSRICKDNHVNYLRLPNRIIDWLNLKQTRTMFKKFFYGKFN